MKKIIPIFLLLLLIFSCNNTELNTKRTVEAENGIVLIPNKPKKIADIAGITDLLVILNQNIVATTNIDPLQKNKIPVHLQPNLKKTSVVGSFLDTKINIEKLKKTKPDLIIANQNHNEILDELTKIAPTVQIQIDIANYKKNLATVAKILNQEKKAEQYLQKNETIIDSLQNKLDLYHTFLPLFKAESKYYVIAKGGLHEALFEDLNLKKAKIEIEIKNNLEQISLEQILKAEADIIVMFTNPKEKKEITKNNKWQDILNNASILFLDRDKYFINSYSGSTRENFLTDLIQEINNLDIKNKTALL